MTGPDLPHELEVEPSEEAPRGRSLGVRLVVIVVVVALLLMTVGIWVAQSGIIFPM